MFDNPNGELKRLENELLQAEMTDDEFDAFYSELFDEFGPADEERPQSSSVNNPGEAAPRSQPRQAAPRKYQTGAAPAFGGEIEGDFFQAASQKDKGVTGLVICACAECLAIAAVMLWWVFRIL